MNTDKNTEKLALTLIEFYATWCPHCKRMEPVVNDVIAQLNGIAEVKQLDIDKNQNLADELEVDTVPTFIIYKGEEEVWRKSGEMTADAIISAVESFA